MSSKECNEKQREFIRQYIIDFNGTAAAIRAGYAEKSAPARASDLLRKRKVREELNRQLDEIFKSDKQEIKARVIQMLQKIAQHDISEFIEIKTKTVVEYVKGDNGELEPVELEKQVAVIKDTADIDTRAVQSIKQNKDGVIEIKFHDPLKAAELLAKYVGMFIDKGEVEHKITYNIIPAPPPEEIEK